MTIDTNIGELIGIIYDQFLVQYGGNEDLASVATAAVINDLLNPTPREGAEEEAPCA